MRGLDEPTRKEEIRFSPTTTRLTERLLRNDRKLRHLTFLRPSRDGDTGGPHGGRQLLDRRYRLPAHPYRRDGPVGRHGHEAPDCHRKQLAAPRRGAPPCLVPLKKRELFATFAENP